MRNSIQIVRRSHLLTYVRGKRVMRFQLNQEHKDAAGLCSTEPSVFPTLDFSRLTSARQLVQLIQLPDLQHIDP